ncbi:MAG: MarR family transcriptional regulator [Candidatus Eremiobacteraeota bacterium]|nr:MarR family transcriptional regulator [Candidatus Eremiobacteraeota bacterium]
MYEVAPAPASVRLGRLENNLGYHLRLAQLRAFSAFAEGAAKDALTPSQFAVLLLIEANPGIKQIELADVLEVDRSTMVRLVDRCEGAKLVRRGSLKTDRRVAPPVLTARGRALIERLEPAVGRMEAAASGLSLSERTMLLQLLRRSAAARQ